MSPEDKEYVLTAIYLALGALTVVGNPRNKNGINEIINQLKQSAKKLENTPTEIPAR